MAEPMIIVGFGNSKGERSTNIFQQKYQKVERFGIKLQITLPHIKNKSNGQIDLSHLSTMMSHRRNEVLLKSFLKREHEENPPDLLEIQQFAKQQIESLNEQLNTIDMFKDLLKINKFTLQTKQSDEVARQYLAEFNGDLNKALQKYRQRKEIVKKFAEKNKLSEFQAESILKDNGYNAALFD